MKEGIVKTLHRERGQVESNLQSIEALFSLSENTLLQVCRSRLKETQSQNNFFLRLKLFGLTVSLATHLYQQACQEFKKIETWNISILDPRKKHDDLVVFLCERDILRLRTRRILAVLETGNEQPWLDMELKQALETSRSILKLARQILNFLPLEKKRQYNSVIKKLDSLIVTENDQEERRR